jgi:hypothetical protein
VLKGLPLAVRDYGDLGLRPMSDIDLLVAPSQADRALDLLEGAGWRDAADVPRSVLWSVHHGSALVLPGTVTSLDLHWQLAGFVPRDFEPRIEPVEIGGHQTTTLDRTDTVLHACLHGAWNGSSATTRWVADAVTVLRAADRAGDPIDGDRLLEVARRYDVGAILGDALEHVVTEHGAPLPAGLPDALRSQRAGWRLRRRQLAVTAPAGGQERVRGLTHLRAYWAYTRWTWSDRQALRAVPTFLRALWGVDSARSLPLAVVTRSLRRLRPGRRAA